MIINDLVLTDEKKQKFERFVFVFNTKIQILDKLLIEFKKFDNKVLNKRVFDKISNAFENSDFRIYFTADYSNNIEINACNKKQLFDYNELKNFLILYGIKFNTRLDLKVLEEVFLKHREYLQNRIAKIQDNIKNLPGMLEEAKKHFESLLSISKDLDFVVKEEYSQFKHIF